MTERAGPGAAGRSSRRTEAYLDEQEQESFPASDAHADWAGPDRPLAAGEQAAGGGARDQRTQDTGDNTGDTGDTSGSSS